MYHAHTYIHTHAHAHTHTHTHTLTYILNVLCTHIHTYIHTDRHTHRHRHTHSTLIQHSEQMLYLLCCPLKTLQINISKMTRLSNIIQINTRFFVLMNKHSAYIKATNVHTHNTLLTL